MVWVAGKRSVQKAFFNALLQPENTLKALQSEGRLTELMVLQEEYLNRDDVNINYIDEVIKYDKEVLSQKYQATSF